MKIDEDFGTHKNINVFFSLKENEMQEVSNVSSEWPK